jgi:aspartyl-tRNA(Asn)/glutamyl-tRNA(Gln) amidotransferase subunit B
MVTEILRYTEEDIMEPKINSSSISTQSSSSFAGLKIEAKHVAELAELIDKNIINRNTAKIILTQIIKTGEMPSQVLARTDVLKIEDKVIISDAVESVFKTENSAVRDAKNNPNVANFLLGKVMKITKGRADPKITLNLIKIKLDGLN